MVQITESQFRDEIPRIIGSWFDGEKGKVSFEKHVGKGRGAVDLVQETAHYRFVVEWKNSASTGLVADAIRNLQISLAEMPKSVKGVTTVPVIAVPFMGEAGQELCRKENISWLDLSGNASVSGPRLKIQIQGKPNRYKGTGRPKNVFAPKSSRIARTLLIEPDSAMTQRELSKVTGLNEALVGRVVKVLEREKFLWRADDGAVRVKDPALLLDAWAESYDFDKHRIYYAFAAQRTGEAAMRSVAENLKNYQIKYAATGLAGAWMLAPFAVFRIASFYLQDEPSDALLERLRLTEQTKAGANVWLIVPNDEGVFEGASERGKDKICCAHPVQVFLDLKYHPERASEAQEAVRREYLNWELGKSR
ncbi:MAG: type IV toxin-antitoxin system AbiEi family antitoxin [Pyrinomonadaceae bacterium]